MNRSFSALLLALSLLSTPVAACAAAATPPAAVPAGEEKRLSELARQYWEETMKDEPEWASTLGDKRYNDKIADYSVKVVHDRAAREERLLDRLLELDAQQLSPQGRLTYQMLFRLLAANIAAVEFKEWQTPVNQMGGVHTSYADLAAQLTFTSAQDYEDWIARLHALPRAFEQVEANMALGIAERRTPPRLVMEKTLTQVKTMANAAPESSPLAAPLQKFPATIPAAERERLRAEMLAVIAKEVLPAYQRLARFLEVSYLPACRTEPGLAAQPGGEAYYKFLIGRYTTTNRSAAELHQIGLEEVQRDEAEMLVIAKKLGYADLKSFRAAVKANPRLKPSTGAELLEAYRATLRPMQQRLPQLFGRLPRQAFEVEAIPEYLAQDAAPAQYQPGAPDGSRPGRLQINLTQLADRNLASVEAIAYHEGLPGHHLQIALAEEMTSLPEFRRFDTDATTAFVEGWALYSERLGKEVGFYQNPFSDFGRLDADIWRAIRLVVDTGVHAQGWSRQQMVDYFHEHSALDEPTIQAEVDRYIAWPAQALAYKSGQLEILALRERAKRELGADFDLRAFHDAVLGSGALSLDVLDENITAWIDHCMEQTRLRRQKTSAP